MTDPLMLERLGAIAKKKAVEETDWQIFLRAVGCNWLVCLAVWMAMAAEDIAGKILAIFFPIMAFVAMGFDHVVANMFFIPAAIFANVPGIDWLDALKNWLFAFLGNLVGRGRVRGRRLLLPLRQGHAGGGGGRESGVLRQRRADERYPARPNRRLIRSHRTEKNSPIPPTGLAACELSRAAATAGVVAAAARRTRALGVGALLRGRGGDRLGRRLALATSSPLGAVGASARRDGQAGREVAHQPVRDVLHHAAAAEARQPAGDREVGDRRRRACRRRARGAC